MAKVAFTPLRNLRRARTLNQADLARLVGVTQQAMSRFERGEEQLPVDVAARLAAILGVSARDIVAEPSEPEQDTEVRA